MYVHILTNNIRFRACVCVCARMQTAYTKYPTLKCSGRNERLWPGWVCVCVCARRECMHMRASTHSVWSVCVFFLYFANDTCLYSIDNILLFRVLCVHAAVWVLLACVCVARVVYHKQSCMKRFTHPSCSTLTTTIQRAPAAHRCARQLHQQQQQQHHQIQHLTRTQIQ